VASDRHAITVRREPQSGWAGTIATNTHTCVQPAEGVSFAPLGWPRGRLSVPELCPAQTRFRLRAG